MRVASTQEFRSRAFLLNRFSGIDPGPQHAPEPAPLRPIPAADPAHRVCRVFLVFEERRPGPGSQSIWFGGREILTFIDRARTTRGRLYVDVGTEEGAGTLRNTRALHQLLRRKGYRKDTLGYLEAEGGKHTESDWAWRLPQALEFLLREK